MSHRYLRSFSMKIANRDAREWVVKQHPFQGSNLYAEYFCADAKDPTEGGHGYVVYSYGRHHPLLVAVHIGGQDLWFANEDGCSQSTKRHMSQCRPDTYSQGAITLHWLSTRWMIRLVTGGYQAIAKERVLKGATA
jgi:hypothetical protein